MNITRTQILSLFQPILARIDMGILFADIDGSLLACNDSARQLFDMEPGSSPDSLSDLGGTDLCERLEQSQGERITPPPEGAVCQRAIQFEMRVGSELDAPRYLQIRSGVLELPCENGFTRIVMARDITREKQLLAATSSREKASLITGDPQMIDLIGRIGIIAPTEASVLLQGESGTGKTEFARMIHKDSNRADGPFVEVNCASIPESLIESELFGHVKGAFTGASQARAGRFRSAHGGTLFLDEINEFPLELQAKLLRVLQSGKFEPVGSDRTSSVDVRIFAASNQELRPLVDHSLFRADLYYRIAVIPLHVPALRERPSDIKLLAEHFLTEFAKRIRPGEKFQLNDDSLRLLLDYPWPGNVRELGNAIEHGVICAQDGLVKPADLPHDLRNIAEGHEPLNLTQNDSDETQRQAIDEALLQAKGNRTLAAKLLQVDRTTLWRRMRRLGFE
ncbi:MAG: sigma 54-interacting transcriptional regulator [Candidatus Thiodiazotropha sp. (ex Lucinoma annulata)]|nr:sigma 54-interacting transcriptional regulator [Candidatus Thiodiazotropha sp. (ex Lucinoma annulata)]